MKEDLLEELLELIELYLSLNSRIQTGSVVDTNNDVIAADPTADLVILRDDIWKRILRNSRILQRL